MYTLPIHTGAETCYYLIPRSTGEVENCLKSQFHSENRALFKLGNVWIDAIPKIYENQTSHFNPPPEKNKNTNALNLISHHHLRLLTVE